MCKTAVEGEILISKVYPLEKLTALIILQTRCSYWKHPSTMYWLLSPDLFVPCVQNHGKTTALRNRVQLLQIPSAKEVWSNDTLCFGEQYTKRDKLLVDVNFWFFH